MEIYGYIYMVKNLINGKIYFGKTENDFDTRYKYGDISNTHNEHLKNSINKYGIENFEINKEFDVAYTEDDLWDLEDMYICLYNTLDKRYGYNKRRSGSKHKGSGRPNEETRKKISKSLQGKFTGEKNPNYGHRWSDEQRKQASETQKRLYKSGYVNPMKGKTLSEEYKQNISKTRKTKGVAKGEKNPMYGKLGKENPNAKTIICLNTLEIFSCIKEAAEKYNISCAGNITNCCKGKNKSAGKHPITGERLHWMYYEDYLKLQENSDTKLEEIA